MADTTSTTELWVERVASWRASGMRAEVFSQHEGYPAGTLRWWASKLKRELGEAAAPRKSGARTKPAEMRLARVVRDASVVTATARTSPIVLEVARAGVRIAIDAGADPATLAMVLSALGVDGGARP